MKTTKTPGVGALVSGTLLAVLLISSHQAYGNGTPAFTIGFDDYSANYWVYTQSRVTFATPSKDTGAGRPVSCNPATEFCWEYAQLTWDSESPADYYYFYFYPQTYGHYHLGFEDSELSNSPCFVDPHDGDGTGFGRTIGGGLCRPGLGCRTTDSIPPCFGRVDPHLARFVATVLPDTDLESWHRSDLDLEVGQRLELVLS